MRNFLVLFVLIVCLAVAACNSNKPKAVKKVDTVAGYAQHPKTAADSDKNDSIAIAQVQQLPEFNRIFKWCQTTNKDTSRHFAVTIGQEPSEGFNNYWIRIGEDTPDHFVDIEQFYVDSKNLSVHYLDPVTDSAMTIEQWRKSGKDKWVK
jgi:hypothetical protein